MAFGVAGYRDFPVPPFGDPADFPYALRSQISTSVAAFQVGLNALSAGGGGDTSEAGLHALATAAVPSGISPAWRPGATRVILWIGDAPSHDGSLEPAYATCCSTTGVASAIGALQAEGIAVFAFSTDPAGLDANGQASAITTATGGTVSELPTASGLATVIVQVIEGPIANPPAVPALSPVGTAAIVALIVAVGVMACARREKMAA